MRNDVTPYLGSQSTHLTLLVTVLPAGLPLMALSPLSPKSRLYKNPHLSGENHKTMKLTLLLTTASWASPAAWRQSKLPYNRLAVTKYNLMQEAMRCVGKYNYSCEKKLKLLAHLNRVSEPRFKSFRRHHVKQPVA